MSDAETEIAHMSRGNVSEDVKTLEEELSNKKLVALTQKQVDLIWELVAHVAYRCGKDTEMYTDFVELCDNLEELTTDPNVFDNHLELVTVEDESTFFKFK